MRILLVAKQSIVEPLGLLFLASIIHKNGWEVDISLINEAKDYNLMQKVCQNNYDFIGLSTYTGFHKEMFKLSDHLRSRGLKTIIGGPHATYFSQDCLSHADFVVKGEGLKSIEGILDGSLKEGIIFVNELVNQIPQPYRDPLYKVYPKFANNPIKNVMSSFGCPYKCSYCYNDSYRELYPDFKIRYRPVEDIIDECKKLMKYPLKLIYFEDDCFGLKFDWLEEFVNSYKHINIPFHCQLRPEMISRERILLLKEAHCHGITLAIETFDETIRREILKRNYSNSNILTACNLIKEYGIKLRTEQMLGVPLTTLEDELNLLKLNIQIKPEIAWTSIFSPYLGTYLGDRCKEYGLYSGNNDDLDNSFFSQSHMNFTQERLDQTNSLHRVFSTCAKIENGEKLAEKFIYSPKHDLDSWFSTMRTHLYDNSLYSL
jgi:radical SAM superfamily enzyme YgiQ (UPF0313 family)